MEHEVNRGEKPPGRASRGIGKACHRCGWVYPNPHPSKRYRNAHRKHCVAAAPALKALDVDVDVGGANGDPGNNGEAVVEKLKSEGGEGKEMGQSGGTGAESHDAIWESDVVESYPELHVQHHDNKVQISIEESTSRQVGDSARSENHSRAIDNVCANEKMEGSQYPFTEGSSKYALMGEIISGAVHYNATGTNNTSNGKYEDKSELTDSEIQKMVELMEFSITADQANAITTAVKEEEAEVEEKQEVSKEEISYVHPNNGFPPAMYTTYLESPPRDDGTSKCQLNPADAQDTREEREEIFKQAGVVDGIIHVPDKQVEPLFNEAIADNLYETLDPYKSEDVGATQVSGLDLQNDFEVGSGNPVSIDMNKLSDVCVREIGQTINFGNENVDPIILQNEEKSSGNQVDSGSLRNVECTTSKVVQFFYEKLASDYVSKTSNTPGVATCIFYKSSEGEDANDEAIQQSDFHIRKIDESTSSNSQTEHQTDPCTGKTDDSLCSNSQIGSIEARWAHFSGENATLRNEVEPNFAPNASTRTNSQAREHLNTSNPTTEAALVTNNSKVIGSSMSIGNKSAYTSIHESEGRNINEVTTPNELDWNSRKSHVMLRNLLDEANLESKQTVTNGQDQKESFRKNWGLQNVGQSIKIATSKVVYDRCKEPSANQANSRKWNSVAGLSSTRRGKKAKGKQGWVPFICCQSMV